MKKALSILLVLTMLLGIVALNADAFVSNSGDVTTEYGYQNVKAAYYGGSLSYNWLFGKSSTTAAKKDSSQYEGEVLVRDALDTEAGSLVIDGKISEGEWGKPVVVVDSDYAASNVNDKGIVLNSTNSIYEIPSAENTYFYNNQGRAPAAGLAFNLYLMWDEDYFYIAVEADDPDGPKQINSGKDVWDGDAVQMIIDPCGPNAAQGGKTYTATTASYTAVSGQAGTYLVKPWTDSAPGEVTGKDHHSCGNYLFSYAVSGSSGGTVAWDAENRWNKSWQAYDYDNQGTQAHWEGYCYYDSDISINETDNSEIAEDPCYAVVRWDNYGTSKARDDKAVYEIAMPWSMITRDVYENYEAEAGNVLGMSLALLNAGLISSPVGAAVDYYNSWLSWGSAVCGYQLNNDPQTAAGSNGVTLSADSYKTISTCDHDFAAATCLAPETCKICGYKRGYASGHSFVFSNVTLPTEKTAGSITSSCTVCNFTEENPIKADSSYLATEYTESMGNPVDYNLPGGFSANWYDDIAANESRKALYKADGTSKNAWDTEAFGYSVLDFATKGEGLYYSDLTPAVISENVTHTTQGGSYWQYNMSGNSMCSSKEYAMSFDFYVPEWTLTELGGGSYYTPSLYMMFGGATGTTYAAGLFYCDDWAYLAIGKEERMLQHLGEFRDPYALTAESFEADCEAFLKLDRSSLKANKWYTINFLFDSDNGAALVFFDGKYVAARDHRYELGLSTASYILLRRFELPFYLKNIRYSSVSWAVENYKLKTENSASYSLTIDGEVSQVAAGETVNLSALAFNEGYRFIGWEGDTSVLTDNVYNASFEMPAQDVTLTSKYVLVGDANGDGKINAQDANFLSQIIVGSVASVVPADINNDDKVNATDSNMLTKMITGTYAPIA